MAEQTEQSYQDFENRNQNSACLLPGKIDLMEPNDNGLLSYDDNGENENVDTSDLSLHEKQFSESSASEMSTSNSNDTGFGSAAVSEITTPVENNYTVTKPLMENAELTAKEESSDSASVQTVNQIEILPNDKAKWESIASTGHKVEENENDEKVTINTIQDESVDLAAQKNKEHNYSEQFSDHKADDSVVKVTHSKEDDKHIEETEQKETESGSVKITAEQEHQETKIESVEQIPQQEMDSGSVEKTAQQEHEETKVETVEKPSQQEKGEIIEKTVQQEIEDKTINKIEQLEIKNENVKKSVLEETEGKRVEKTEDESFEQTVQQETDDESFERTSFKEVNYTNIHHSVTEDENSTKLVNGKAEKEHAEHVSSKETSVTKEASYKVEDVNIEKTTSDKLESNLEKVEQKVLNTKNAETDVPEDKHDVNVEQTKSHDEHDEREAHRPVQDENICKTEENNIEITAAENEDDINASLNKVVEGSVSNANNNLAESESVENVKCKLTEGDYSILNVKSDEPEDEDVENGTVNKKEDVLAHSQVNDEIVRNVNVDNSHDENESSNHRKNNNSQEDVGNKIDHENLQQAESDKEDEQTTDEQKENVMDILGNGLLTKKVLVPGKGVHTRPTSGEVVTVKVDGQLPDGTHVDTGEISFNLNDGDVILAFDLAVALMEEGEKCELFTSERYAYGALGRDPDIPKDTSITYILELVSVQKPPTVSELSYDQRLKMGEAKRERGNYLFGRGDYSGAINSYNRAVKLLDNPELNEKIDESCRSILTESSVKCYNNLAASQLKIDALDAAIKSCERVLSVQEDNVKALFRLGKAYGAKGEVDQALTYLRRAVRLDPESKLMQQEMLNLTRRKNKEAATEKELYQRMLGVKPGAKPAAEEDNKRSNSNKLVKWTLLAGGVAAVLISVGLSWYRAS